MRHTIVSPNHKDSMELFVKHLRKCIHYCRVNTCMQYSNRHFKNVSGELVAVGLLRFDANKYNQWVGIKGI
jgi:hypothetical protein